MTFAVWLRIETADAIPDSASTCAPRRERLSFALRELRAQSGGRPLRVFYAFGPKRLCLRGGFLCFTQIARAMGIGTERSRLIAALGYALAPRVLTEIGPLSSEMLPQVLPGSHRPMRVRSAG